MNAVVTVVLFFGGCSAVTVALWWLHPSAGLCFAGAVAALVGLALSKANDTEHR